MDKKIINWKLFKEKFPLIYEDIREFESKTEYIDGKDLIIKYSSLFGIDAKNYFTIIPVLEKINSEFNETKMHTRRKPP